MPVVVLATAFCGYGELQAGGSSGGYYAGYGSYGSSGSRGGYASSGGLASSGGYASAGSLGAYAGRVRTRVYARYAASSGGASSGGASLGGSSGAYAAAYSASSGGASSGGASSGGSSGRTPILQRLASKMRAHRAALSASSGGASSGGASSGGASSGGSSGGSSGRVVYRVAAPQYSGGSQGGSSGNVVYTAPMASSRVIRTSPIARTSRSVSPARPSVVRAKPVVAQAANSVAAQPTHTSRKATIDTDAALLTVAVPVKSAKVTVNDNPTESGGLLRQFMSRGLKEDYLYTYVVKVDYELDGETISDSKTVKLGPGDTERVVFRPSAETSTSQQEAAIKPIMDPVVDDRATPAETVVKLIVPADAKVVLAGNPAPGNGPERVFRTTQLQPGQAWRGYTVQVTTKVDGREVTKQRTVDIQAGSTTELSFEFDDSTFALR